MKTRIGRTLLPILVLLALHAAPAAATWSVGSNFGLDLVRSSGSSSLLTLGWPGNSFGYAPGMRVGYRGEHSPERFYIDSGLLLLSSTGSTFTTIQLSANFQHNFSTEQPTTPYVTIGVGFYSIDPGGGSSSYTVPTMGGGIGATRSLSGGHGDFRTEFHVDHLSRDKSKGVPGITTFGLKLGFDLWLK